MMVVVLMLVVSDGSDSGGDGDGVSGGGGSSGGGSGNGSCGGGNGSCGDGGNCGGGNDFDYDEVRCCLACDTEDRKEDHSIKDSR